MMGEERTGALYIYYNIRLRALVRPTPTFFSRAHFDFFSFAAAIGYNTWRNISVAKPRLRRDIVSARFVFNLLRIRMISHKR